MSRHLLRTSLAVTVALVVAGCGGDSSAHDRVTRCLDQYHAATPDAIPTNNYWSGVFGRVIYAIPCSALSPGGEGRWEVLVVGHDDKTIRIYFIGGTVGDRSGLLRTVNIDETSSKVTIQLEVGGDPSNPGSASSAVGQSYVTQILLSQPLAGRTLAGPNKRGVIERL